MNFRFKTLCVLVAIMVLLSLFLVTACKDDNRTYTVTFIVDGEIHETIEVKSGMGLIPPEVPAKTGYKGEWDIKAFDKIIEDLIVTAVYTPRLLKVVFKAEDNNNILKTVDIRTVNYGESLTYIPQVPAREGYSGVWNRTDFSNIVKDIEVLAVYTKNTYTVEFVTNGGNEIEALHLSYGDPINVSVSRNGYEFMGWYTDSDFKQPFTLTNMPAQNLVLYARWEIIQFLVTVNTQMPEYDDIIYKAYGGIIESLTEYARTGYVFNGWYLDQEFTKPLTLPYTVTENVTFYADWIKDNRNYATDYTYFVFDSDKKEISLNPDKDLPVDIIIPSVYNNTIVEGIADYAFEGADINKIVIPESILRIGHFAFRDSSLTDCEFDQDSRLREIGNGAFMNTGISQIVLPLKLKQIGHAAFYNCVNLETIFNIALLNELEVVGGLAIENTSYYNGLLDDLAQQEQGGTVIYIGNVLYSVYGDVSEIDLWSNIVSISSQAFMNKTLLTRLSIPDTVKYIGGSYCENGFDIKGAFHGCSSLQRVITTPYSQLYTVGEGAFSGCGNIQMLPTSADMPIVKLFGKEEGENTYLVNYFGEDYYVPRSLIEIDIYSNGEGIIRPYSFAHLIYLETLNLYGDIIEIGDYGFYNCQTLNNITIPAAVENIGDFAFAECYNMEAFIVQRASKLKLIGQSAFENMSRAIIDLGELEELVSVGDYAFRNCENLTVFKAPAINELGQGVFENCKLLNAISVPSHIENIFVLFGTGEEQEDYYSVNGRLIPLTLSAVNIALSQNQSQTAIASGFMEGLEKIKNISIPDGITDIGQRAFYGLGIESLIVPDSVITIGKESFASNIKLISLTLSNALKVIPEQAFAGCDKLEQIFIPASIEEIDLTTFENCSALESISVYDNNHTYYDFEGALYRENALLLYPEGRQNDSYTLSQGTKHIYSQAFKNSKLKNIVFNAELLSAEIDSFDNCEFESVTIYGDAPLSDIFADTSIIDTLIIKGQIIIEDFASSALMSSLILWEGVEEIGVKAFENCSNLISLQLPSTIQKIHEKAFNGCLALETMDFGSYENLVYIGKDAFAQTLWLDSFSDGTIYIGNIAYSYKGIMPEDTHLAINEGVTAIADYAFANQQNIVLLSLPDSLREIGVCAFKDASSIVEIVFNDNLTTIKDGAFEGLSNLQKITFNSQLKFIGNSAFKNAQSLESIILPEGLEHIGDSAFENCQALPAITIPSTVAYVGSKAFYNCLSAATVNLGGIDNIEFFGDKVFHFTQWYALSNGILMLNDIAVYGYKGDSNAVNIPNEALKIMPYAFYNNASLETVYFNRYLREIGAYAFAGCSSLRNLNFNQNEDLEHIGEYAFKDCLSLEEFYIPYGLESFDLSILEGCVNLRNFFIENEDLHGSYRFFNGILYNNDFTQIKYVPFTIGGNVVLEDTVVSIPDFAFAGRTEITSVTIPSSVETIGQGSFKDCVQLTEIIISGNSKLTSIGKEAFYNTLLTTINLPVGISYLGENAFDYTDMELTFTSSVPPQIEGSIPFGAKFFVPRNLLELYKERIVYDDIYPSMVRVQFLINKVLLKAYDIPYGGKLSEIPSINPITGYSGAWKASELAWVYDANSGEYLNIYRDININAVYTKNSYRIIYDDGESITEQLVKYEDTITLLLPEDSSVKQFLFWTQDGVSRFELSTMPANDISLTAKWFRFEYIYDEAKDAYIVRPSSDNEIYDLPIAIPSRHLDKPVYKIADNAFSGKPVTAITLTDSILEIGQSAFENSAIEEIVLGDNLAIIRKDAFKNSALIDISFPQNMELIGESSFEGCNNLTLIDIVIDINAIDKYAFKNAENLRKVKITSPDGAAADGILAQGVFQNCYSLFDVILPVEVDTIKESAFKNCYNLAAIDLSFVEYFESSSFQNCQSLQQINLSNAISVGDYAFNNCVNINNIYTLNNEVMNTIGECAFYGCAELAVFVLPATVKNIHNQAFGGCDNLRYFVIMENGNEYDGSKGLNIGEDVVGSGTDIYVSLDLEYNTNKWPNNMVKLYKNIYDGFVVSTNNDLLLYVGLNEQVTLPDIIGYDYINGIGEDIFICSQSITEMVIPDRLINYINDGRIFRPLVNLTQIVSSASDGGTLYSSDGKKIIAYPAGRNNSVFEVNEDIEEIAEYAFSNASALETITFNGQNPPVIFNSSFVNLNDNLKFYAPANALNSYKTAEVWSQYADRIYPSFIRYNDLIIISHNEGLEISQYLGNQTEIDIPISLNGKNVVSIGDYAFYNSSLESITLPIHIAYIGNYAFAQSKELIDAYLPAAIKSMGKSAFENCVKLQSIQFNSKILLTLIQENTFKGCSSLLRVDIPSKAQVIGKNAFYGANSLHTVNIPVSSALSVIEENAFLNCNSLKNINLQAAKQLTRIADYAFAECGGLEELRLPESLLYIQNYAFYNCASLKKLIFDGSSKLTEIGERAFVGCENLLRITIPDSVIRIGSHAFYENNLQQIIFTEASRLSVIEDYAFAYSNNVKELHLFGNVSLISQGAFINSPSLRWLILSCENPPVLQDNVWDDNLRIYVPNVSINLYKNTWPASSRHINAIGRIAGDYSYVETEGGVEIFQYMGEDKNVEIPEKLNDKSVVSIGSYAFGAEVDSVIIPDSIKSLKASSFYRSNITNIYLTKYIIEIEDNPFTDCKQLAAVEVDEENIHYVSIGGVLFNSDRTKIISYPNALDVYEYSYNIPYGIKEIGKEAFKGSDKLVSVTIPATVNIVGENAFLGCLSLTDIDFINATLLTYVGSDAFSLTEWIANKADGVIYLESSSRPDSFTALGYKGIMPPQTSIELHENTISILPNAFRNLTNLINISIPSCVEYIGENILYGCYNLTQLTMPGSYALGYLFGKTSYSGSYAAFNSQKNTYYYIPNNLTKVNIAEGSDMIVDYAFTNCHNIININIGNSVKYIGRYAFYSDTESMLLENVVFNDVSESVLVTIGSYAFAGCRQIKQINLPYNLKEINSHAFRNCTQLTTVIFEDAKNELFGELKYIGNNAFENCYDLSKLDMSSSLEHIGSKAFLNCTSLFSVYFDTINSQLKQISSYAFMNCTNLREITTPRNLSVIGDRAFYNCHAMDHFIYAASSESLTYIGYEVFHSTPYYNELLTRPENQNTIIYFANIAYNFNGFLSSGTIISLKDNTVSVSPYLFANQTEIHEVNMVRPDSTLGVVIVVNPTLRIIGRNAFFNNGNLSKVILPSTVKEIGANAFANCRFLEEITFQNSDNIEFIGQDAFYNTPWYQTLYESQPNNSIIYIGRIAYKFKGSMQENTEIELAENTVSISPYAFEKQTGLISIHIPSSIKNISQFAFGEFIFGGQSRLQTVYIDKEADLINNIAGIFTISSKVILNTAPVKLDGSCHYSYEVDEDGSTIIVTEEINVLDLMALYKEKGYLPNIYVPREYYNDYLFADGWSEISEFLIPYEGIYSDYAIALTEDGQGADVIYYVGNSSDIVMPDILDNKPIKGIMSYAFNTAVTNLSLSNTIEYIHDYAFANCLSLTNIILPATLKEIGASAFENCISLTAINIPSSVRTIGEYAFYKCYALSRVTFENGVEILGEYAFAECVSLKNISIPFTVKSMGGYIFNDCDSLRVLIMTGMNPPQLDINGLYYSSLLKIFVADDYYENYINDYYWTKYSMRTYRLSELANDLLDAGTYIEGEEIQLSFAPGINIAVYIAPMGLGLSDLLQSYEQVNDDTAYITLPQVGYYVLYVVIDDLLVSTGTNQIIVLQP